MEVIREQMYRCMRLNQYNIFNAVLTSHPEIQRAILDMNRYGQLYERGIASTGRPLGDYAFVTILEKIRKGQRYDHVTLHDTGAFYDSFRLQLYYHWIEVEASLIKEGKSLEARWGDDILGLTDESVYKLAEMMYEPFVEETKRQLLGS